MSRHDVLVVGGGLSGLAAADRLHAAGRDVLVLEARDRVGGRTYSPDIGGYRFDLGGQWLDPQHQSMLDLAGRFGIELYPQYRAGKNVMTLDGHPQRFHRLIPPIGARANLRLGWELAKQSWLCWRLGHRQPADDSRAAELDQQTLADYLDASVSNRRTRHVLDIASQMLMAAEPSDYSLLYYLRYLRQGGGPRRLLDVEDGAQDLRLLGGAQRVSECLLEAIERKIVFGAAVSTIAQSDDHVRLTTTGGSFEARRVILAIPPPLIGAIDATPNWHPQRLDLHRSMQMGRVLKMVVVFPTPFWRKLGLSGETVSGEGPIRATFDSTPPDGPAALVAFAVGDGATTLAAIDEAARREQLLAFLRTQFGQLPEQPIAYADQAWQEEPFSRGGYVGLLGPGGLRHGDAVLSEPAGRVHFAGTETASRWCGYMAGAVEAGQRAANEVIAAA